jgi:hypothetical protein
MNCYYHNYTMLQDYHYHITIKIPCHYYYQNTMLRLSLPYYYPITILLYHATVIIMLNTLLSAIISYYHYHAKYYHIGFANCHANYYRHRSSIIMLSRVSEPRGWTTIAICRSSRQARVSEKHSLRKNLLLKFSSSGKFHS